MPENLDQVTSFPPKNVQIAGMRVALQYLLNLNRQAVHAAPHVGVPDRQPHPHPGRYRDHRRDNALTMAAANSGEIEPGMRARTFPANSISMAEAVQDVAPFAASSLGLSAGAISTWANPAAEARNSCRQR